MTGLRDPRPRIGIPAGVARPPADVAGRGARAELPHAYADAVLRAGGLPLVLPSVLDPGDVGLWLEALDGLLLPGGDDFDTARIGLEPTHPTADPVPGSKQDQDLALARAAVERGVPVLGICYGMQVLGLAHGARLLQHLPEDRPGGRPHAGGALHPVRPEPGSKLARALGVGPRGETVDVISRHHQALADVPAPWIVSGRDDQGLIEALEHPDHPFALGVQWHPELAPGGSPMEGLFRALVEAAAVALPARSH